MCEKRLHVVVRCAADTLALVQTQEGMVWAHFLPAHRAVLFVGVGLVAPHVEAKNAAEVVISDARLWCEARG